MKLYLLNIFVLFSLSHYSQSYYSSCDIPYEAGDPSALFKCLRDLISSGKPGSYSDLWDTYLKVYVKNDGYIKDYYSSYTKFTSLDKDDGTGGNKEGQKYNREHTIPKSWWGGTTARGTQGADPFIVVPTDKYINTKRSNFPFGKVAKVKYSSIDGYSKLGEGDSEYGYTGTVFEPNDEVKGDLARIVFYSLVMYNKAFNWTLDEGSVVYSGDENKNFGLTDYAVKLFLEWNEIDPPDEWEVKVNNDLYDIQGNKNPFVDHPEYISLIWGNKRKYNNSQQWLKKNKLFILILFMLFF